MKAFRPQFRLRSLFILTALVAVGCLTVPWAVKHWAADPDADAMKWKDSDGRSFTFRHGGRKPTVTEYDDAGNPATVEMKAEGNKLTATMPSGKTVTISVERNVARARLP
jgi:hypothetical protein